MDFNFKRKKFSLQKAQYGNKRIALVIVMKETGKRYGILTTNVPELTLEDGEFAVKTWAENKEIAEVIFDTGIFEDTGKRAKNEFVSVEFWKFKDPRIIDNLPLFKQI